MDGLDDDRRFCPDESRFDFDSEDAQAFASSRFHSLLVAVFCLFAAFALSCLHKWRAHRAQAKSHGGAVRPIKVGCFYCGCTQTVLELQKDSWTCSSCDALNVGFNEEGDYRTVPREMYDETLNCRIPPREVVNPSAFYFSTTRETVSPQNVLCERCQINQTLWLQQLSSFVPKDERSEDKELEVLKRHLDRVYALCSQCAAGVAAELERKHKVIEHMSIAKRIADSAKNNIRKMRSSKQIFRSFNKGLQVYRVLSLILLLAVCAERLYAKIYADSEEGVGEELLVERCLLVLLRCPFLLKDALCYLALSLFPLDLMLAACRPKGALLPHKHTPQLFVELFLCCLQAIPLLDMKSERVALDGACLVLNLLSVLLLLVLELPVAEVVFSRLVRHGPSSRLDRSSEQEGESASLPVSPVRTSASASTSASSFCYQTTPSTLRQRQPFPPAPLAFTAPPNPFSQLGVEDDLANISLFEEDAMAMDWNLH